MQINTKSIKSHFEKSMDKYDKNAVVQRDMAEKLSKSICKISDYFENILELGAGTGLLTREIKNKVTFKTYIANDLSDKSQQYLDKILDDFTFVHGNAQKIKPSKKVDLIASNAMFQWFSNLEKSFDYYKNFLNKNGIFAFSTFGKENFKELKDLTSLTLGYLSKNELINILEPNFEILHIEEYTKVMEFSSPLELLAHMKNTGVNSLTSKTWTVKDVKDFCTKYLEKYNKSELTYNPIIVVAKVKT